jgi:hypothetical protein
MLRGLLIPLFVLALAAPAIAAEPGDDGGTINIMKPEPKTSPARDHKRIKKTRKARGSSNPVYPTPLPGPQAPAPVPHLQSAPRRGRDVPPALLVPQTGRLLPNLPPAGGTETLQDRSVRCAHQAGVYGPALTGDQGSYIRSCINQ